MIDACICSTGLLCSHQPQGESSELHAAGVTAKPLADSEEEVMEIGSWLRSIGLSQYEAVFHAHEIDLDILADITEIDLDKLQLSMGARKRLRKAIEALEQPSESKRAVSPIDADEGERRQLTVLFCDLVGSTELSARLDPEDVRKLIRLYQNCCSQAITNQEGFIAKYLGDGVVAYFGYPYAREDDVERAVYAAIDLIRRLGNLGPDIKLEARVGIATGLVVVGDVIGVGVSEERAVTGDTPNMAARLQSLAAPGEIIVSANTQRLFGNVFHVVDLGPQYLKGFADLVPSYRVLNPVENPSRFDATRGQRLSPFVGRDQELSLLAGRWELATEGEGQIVLVSGEAGVGKSRLLAELRRQIQAVDHALVQYQCSPRHTNDALFPFIEQLRRASGVVGTDSASVQFDLLDAYLSRQNEFSKEISSALSFLLHIQTESDHGTTTFAPAELKRHAFSAFLNILRNTFFKSTTLIIIEDAHWIDPTSVELIEMLIKDLANQRVLLIMTYRSNFSATWVGRTQATALTLGRFGRRYAAALISRIFESRNVEGEVAEQIISRADGVPLFLEELARNMLETGDQTNGHVGSVSSSNIPITLQDLLMARLDRMGQAKEVAQAGAVIGRDFSFSLLHRLTDIKQDTLGKMLETLIDADLINGSGSPPESTYTFQHALVQDAAYESLLKTRRQNFHRRLVGLISDGRPGGGDDPASIAHHAAEGGLHEIAVQSWLAAAEQGLSRSAYTEAGRAVESGMAFVSLVTEVSVRQRLEFALHLARANTLLPVNGYAEPATVAALTKCKELLDAGAGTDIERMSVLHGLCAANYMGGRMEIGLALAREMVDFSETQEDPIYRLLGYRVLGSVDFYMGNYRDAVRNLETALTFSERSQADSLSYRFGWNSYFAAKCFLMWALIHIGDTDKASNLRNEIVTESQNYHHAPTRAACIWFTSVYWSFFFVEYENCWSESMSLIEYCQEREVRYWRELSENFRAVAAAMIRPDAGSIAEIGRSVARSHASGTKVADSIYLTSCAEASIEIGDLEAAGANLRQAFAHVDQTGERFWLAAILRAAGKLEYRLNYPSMESATAAMVNSIQVAMNQGSFMVALRSIAELIEMRRDSISVDEAERLLSPVINLVSGAAARTEIERARRLVDASATKSLS